MRLFIAIRLSKAMKEALLDLQRALHARGVRGNFTPEENLHLTLAFIGEYPDAEAVSDALAGVSFTPFTLHLAGMGCFGDLWWAGLDRSEALGALARRVRHALSEGGYQQTPEIHKLFSREAPTRWYAIGASLVSLTVV